jgi:hypothetical protein
MKTLLAVEADYPNCQLTESSQPRNASAKQTSLFDISK